MNLIGAKEEIFFFNPIFLRVALELIEQLLPLCWLNNEKKFPLSRRLFQMFLLWPNFHTNLDV